MERQQRSKANIGGMHLVPNNYATVKSLRKIHDAAGQQRSSTEKGRQFLRNYRLNVAKRMNQVQLAETGRVEWNFVLVKTVDGARVPQLERRQMTQRTADLKNKTMEGTGKQWCRIN